MVQRTWEHGHTTQEAAIARPLRSDFPEGDGDVRRTGYVRRHRLHDLERVVHDLDAAQRSVGVEAVAGNRHLHRTAVAASCVRKNMRR